MIAPHTGTSRLATVVLALAALAALLPAGVSAASPDGARDAAPAGTVDSLWASANSSIAACPDPASPTSLATCFPDAPSVGYRHPIATDGVNVYGARDDHGAWSCPVAGLGSGCTRVMAGPWPQGRSVDGLAAADGSLWIGQGNGKIYRCPSDLPWQSQDAAPSACVLLDDAGSTDVTSLLLANGRLYAGLDSGLIWSCDPYVANACTRLDDAGRNAVQSLAAGAGYLWAGLKSGVVWRCDPSIADRCRTWDTAGAGIVSLSYDGAGTLYAAIYKNAANDYGAIWSCPVATADACTTISADGPVYSVTAGSGSVFWTTSVGDGLRFGTTPFVAAGTHWNYANVLYIPAGGLPALGAANVQVRYPEAAKRLAARCADGVPLIAHVRVTGPNDFRWRRTVDVCRIRNPKMPDVRLGLLDPGTYHVRVRTPKHEAEGSVVVTGGSTHPLILQLLGRK